MKDRFLKFIIKLCVISLYQDCSIHDPAMHKVKYTISFWKCKTFFGLIIPVCEGQDRTSYTCAKQNMLSLNELEEGV